MRYIVLIGDSSSAADRRHAELFRDSLAVSGGEALAAKDIFFSADGGLLLAQTGSLERMPRGGVAVFKESFSEKHSAGQLSGCSAVVSSENEHAVRLLSPGGWGMVEINEALGGQTAEVFRRAGLAKVEIIRDFFGKERFVSFFRQA